MNIILAEKELAYLVLALAAEGAAILLAGSSVRQSEMAVLRHHGRAPIKVCHAQVYALVADTGPWPCDQPLDLIPRLATERADIQPTRPSPACHLRSLLLFVARLLHS